MIPAAQSKVSILSTVSKARSPPSYHDRAAPKLVSHRVDSDKRIRKQIRNIQKAIKQESSRKSSKANSGILRGLKKALAKLNDTRIRSSHSHLSQSQSQSSQKRSYSPEKESCIEKPLFSDPIQEEVPHITQQLLTEPEKALSFSNKSTTEEPSPNLFITPSPQPLVENQPIGVSVSTIEAETNMAKETSPNGQEGLEERDSASADHDMSDAESNTAAYLPLTEKCHHYTRRSDVDWDIQKYWAQRYSIFSLYDEGIHMTDDSWFGVTPEPVANKVAEDLSALTPKSKTVLIDMFAGAGGNVIAFALSKRWSTIIAIEKDPSVIACAQHNANIYGVFEQITWINDDSFSYLEKNSTSIDPSKTVIFASPPWGGPGYTTDKIFNLNTMAPYSIKQIHNVCRGMDSALYLPRTSDLRQIAKLAPGEEKIEVVQYCMEGASKALVAYIPAIALTSS